MSPDNSASITNGLSYQAVLTFFNTTDQVVASPGTTPVYRLMDQFFNAERNDGVFTIDQNGAIQAIANGTQALEVDIDGLPPYRLSVIVAAAGGNGSGPAVRFVVTIREV